MTRSAAVYVLAVEYLSSFRLGTSLRIRTVRFPNCARRTPTASAVLRDRRRNIAGRTWIPRARSASGISACRTAAARCATPGTATAAGRTTTLLTLLRTRRALLQLFNRYRA